LSIKADRLHIFTSVTSQTITLTSCCCSWRLLLLAKHYRSIFRLWDFISIQHSVVMTWYNCYICTRYRSVSMHLRRRTCIYRRCYYLHHYLYQNSQSSLKSCTMLLEALARANRISNPVLRLFFRIKLLWINTILHVFAYSRVWWQLDYLGGNGEWRQKSCTRRRINEEWSTWQRQRSGSIKAETAGYCWVQTHAAADKASSRTHHISNHLSDNP